VSSARRRGPLARIYLSVFLFVAGEGAMHVLVAPYLSRELELGPAAIGVVVSVFGGASLLARVPAGAAYSARRRRRLLLFGGGLSSGAFLAVPVVSGAVPFAVLMALDGFGWSVATTTQLAALMAARPAEMRIAAAMGWYSGFTGLGHTAGAALGGVAADRLGFQASFVILAGVVALGTAVMAAAAPGAGHGPAPSAVATARRRAIGGRVRTVRRAIANMPVGVWIGALVMAYINFVNGIQTTFHPVLVLAAGLSLTQVGILASCRSGASSVVRLGSGPLFARIGTAHLTLPLMVVAAASLFLLPTVQASFLWQVPLFLATGLSRGLLRVSGSAGAFEAVGDDERHHGLTAALVHAGLDVGKIAGPLVGGAVAQLIGLAAMFRVLPLVLLALYVALHVAARRSSDRVAPPAAVTYTGSNG
jgi:predicted MFS family arabinose efflux permease